MLEIQEDRNIKKSDPQTQEINADGSYEKHEKASEHKEEGSGMR